MVMYAAQATRRQWLLHQSLELYLVTALQMNWHFIDIAMIMSIYLIEQFKNLITVNWVLILQSIKTELENDKLKRNA